MNIYIYIPYVLFNMTYLDLSVCNISVLASSAQVYNIQLKIPRAHMTLLTDRMPLNPALNFALYMYLNSADQPSSVYIYTSIQENNYFCT